MATQEFLLLVMLEETIDLTNQTSWLLNPLTMPGPGWFKDPVLRPKYVYSLDIETN